MTAPALAGGLQLYKGHRRQRHGRVDGQEHEWQNRHVCGRVHSRCTMRHGHTWLQAVVALAYGSRCSTATHARMPPPVIHSDVVVTGGAQHKEARRLHPPNRLMTVDARKYEWGFTPRSCSRHHVRRAEKPKTDSAVAPLSTPRARKTICSRQGGMLNRKAAGMRTSMQSTEKHPHHDCTQSHPPQSCRG